MLFDINVDFLVSNLAPCDADFILRWMEQGAEGTGMTFIRLQLIWSINAFQQQSKIFPIMMRFYMGIGIDTVFTHFLCPEIYQNEPERKIPQSAA